MGTITMSGFNKIDWSSILEAVMTQERQPLTTMQTQRTALASQSKAFGTLAGRLTTLQSAASSLADLSQLGGRTATVSDSAVLTASASSTAVAGSYDVVVKDLARAQVTTLGAGSSDPALAQDAVVATGGTLTFLDATGQPILDANGQQTGVVTLAAGSYTLQQLADKINATAGVPARATVVQANGNYRLVLSGTATGQENGFTLQNALTGGAALSETLATAASDADVLINNVEVTSATNTFSEAIDGVSLTVLRKTSLDAPAVVNVAEDPNVTKSKLSSFVQAFNGLIDFVSSQATSARSGDTGSIGHNAMLRGLRSTLSAAINGAYPVGGEYESLATIGLEFDRTGKLQINQSVLTEALKNHREDVEHLLAGVSGATGAFEKIEATIAAYSQSGGLVPSAQSRLDDQVKQLDDRMAAMEDRLAIRQRALAAEYAAADQMISQLNSQGSSLSSLVSSYSAF